MDMSEKKKQPSPDFSCLHREIHSSTVQTWITPEVQQYLNSIHEFLDPMCMEVSITLPLPYQ